MYSKLDEKESRGRKIEIKQKNPDFFLQGSLPSSEAKRFKPYENGFSIYVDTLTGKYLSQIYWCAYSYSRRGVDGGNRYFSQLYNMKIWCNIQVIIYRFLQKNYEKL